MRICFYDLAYRLNSTAILASDKIEISKRERRLHNFSIIEIRVRVSTDGQ